MDFEASDKVGHLLAYAALMFWFSQLYLSRSLRLIHAAIFLLMGIGLEVLQGISGLRTYEIMDMLANTAGVLLGWLAARLAPPLLRP
ncbi:MAG TPA: VanZ family protein [Burkholderiales bacterium]|nr:VanZ family protein [Burkholderiales bacterium]